MKEGEEGEEEKEKEEKEEEELERNHSKPALFKSLDFKKGIRATAFMGAGFSSWRKELVHSLSDEAYGRVVVIVCSQLLPTHNVG